MNARLETRHLTAFLVLAEELHFGRAAERLRMAQPPFSQQIRRLEQQVGTRLFERTTRSVKLTEAGRLFLEKIRFAMNQMEDAVRLARLAAAGASAHLSLGFIQPAMYSPLPAALRSFVDRYPRVMLQLDHLSSSEQVKALLEGRLDMGLIRPPANAPGLRMEVVSREGFSAVLPVNHPLTRRARIELASLAGERFIDFRSSASDVFPQHVALYCRRAGFEPNFVFSTTTTAATLTLVAAGLGIALFPHWARHIAPAQVVFRAVPEIPPIVELAAAWVPRAPSAAAQNFLEILLEQREPPVARGTPRSRRAPPSTPWSPP